MWRNPSARRARTDAVSRSRASWNRRRIASRKEVDATYEAASTTNGTACPIVNSAPPTGGPATLTPADRAWSTASAVGGGARTRRDRLARRVRQLEHQERVGDRRQRGAAGGQQSSGREEDEVSVASELLRSRHLPRSSGIAPTAGASDPGTLSAFSEGGRGDSNPRPPGPQPGALPTELLPPRGRHRSRAQWHCMIATARSNRPRARLSPGRRK